MKAPTKLMLSIIDQPESHEEVEDFVKYWTPLVDRVLVRPYLANLGLTEDAGNLGIKERWPCPQFWKRITINAHGELSVTTKVLRKRGTVCEIDR